MITGPIAGDRIRALAGEVCRVSPCWWPGTEGVRAAGASGLAGVAARGPGLAEHGVPVVFDDEDRDRDDCDAAGRAGGHAIWTHPFSGHVPSLRQVQPPHWARRITARRLLSHRAGLPNSIPVRWVHPADQPPPDPDRVLHGLLACHAKLRFEPGSTV